MEFEKLLGKENPMLKSIRDRGFKVPSEIQKKSIPAILEGKDVVAGASTGSGKTLGFAAGLIKNTEKDGGIQGLILTPTRELAEQVADELRDFARYVADIHPAVPPPIITILLIFSCVLSITLFL